MNDHELTKAAALVRLAKQLETSGDGLSEAVIRARYGLHGRSLPRWLDDLRAAGYRVTVTDRVRVEWER
jgi:hypothetical protein